MNGWIDARERLPSERQQVLVYVGGEFPVETAVFEHNRVQKVPEFGTDRGTIRCDDDEPTWWMPLPPHPE